MKHFTAQEVIDMIANLSIKSKEMAESQKEMSESQKEIAESQKKTDEQMKRTDEQMKKTDEKLKRMGIHLGNISANNGAVAEEFFYSSLKKNKKLGNIIYDEIGREWKKDFKNLRGEYDIVLINGKELAIVEVKYKIHHNDVEIMKKKITDFPLLFPDYKNFIIRGAFASLSMSKKAEQEILNNGYFALKQQGNHVEVSVPDKI